MHWMNMEIYRSLTEHLAAEMGRWLIGPMFWYLVGGLFGVACLCGQL